MPHHRPLVDPSRPKRGNEECSGLWAKRQRRLQSPLETAAEHEDAPQIRGGLARPRPPSLGPPPNRATRPATQANTTNPPVTKATPSEARKSGTRILGDEEYPEDYEEDWRPQSNQQTSTAALQPTPTPTTGPQNQGPTGPPKQPPKVGTTAMSVPIKEARAGPGGGPARLATPPDTSPSNEQQGGAPGAGTSAGGSSVTTAGTARVYPTEQEIVKLFERLQRMVCIWVEACLPDTFPEEFQTEKPERYWELCGWTKPVALGESLLQNRSLAKYVYESWVWRFLHQEIFRLDSLAWAGGGVGKFQRVANSAKQQFGFIRNKKEQTPSAQNYQGRIEVRAKYMEGSLQPCLVSQERKDLTTAWIVEEMLVAFHPYFSDEYRPIERADNIEVLIRDTRFLILKAQELDFKMRSASHVYDMILGSEGDVCRISATPSPKLEGYRGRIGERVLRNDDSIALIVVPGLVRVSVLDDARRGPRVSKRVVRNARAFTQLDFRKEMGEA